jgi:hypothetical protein
MKTALKKKLSIMFVLVLVVSLFTGLSIQAAAEGNTKYLAFTSDVHYDTTKANNLETWLGNMKSAIKSVDYMGICGDLGSAYAKTPADYWDCVKGVQDTVDKYVTSGFITKGAVYTMGNHEWYPFAGGDLANNQDNAVAKKYLEIGEAVKTDAYIIYCFGASVTAGAQHKQEYTLEDIATLKAYLDKAPTDIPIIVLTHFPLHNWPGRTITNAAAVVDVLNAHPNVIYLWGHNHTNSDTHYDNMYTVGDTLTVAPDTDKKINFTYMSAGCMSDSEYGPGSAFVKGKGLVMAIDGPKVTFNYYTMDGKALDITKTVDVTVAAPVTPEPTPAPDTSTHTVVLSDQAVSVDGVTKKLEVYNIDGSNYFKLRDLAFVLSGTGSQFSVSYDNAKKAISCATGTAYTADGSELVIGADKASSAVPSTQSLYIDGKLASLSAFNIGGNNFFKLRDLGTALKFNVNYDDATRTMLITSNKAG